MALLKVPAGEKPPPPAAKKAIAKPAAPAAPSEDAAARIKRREDGAMGWMQIGSFLCITRGQFANVGTISAYGPGLCHESAVLAESNDTMARGMDFMAMAGPYSALLASALPFALQLAANMGRIDYKSVSQLGVVDPEMMAAKAKLDMLKMQQDAQEAKDRADQEMRDMIARAEGFNHDQQFAGAAAN